MGRAEPKKQFGSLVRCLGSRARRFASVELAGCQRGRALLAAKKTSASREKIQMAVSWANLSGWSLGWAGPRSVRLGIPFRVSLESAPTPVAENSRTYVRTGTDDGTTFFRARTYVGRFGRGGTVSGQGPQILISASGLRTWGLVVSAVVGFESGEDRFPGVASS